MLTSKSKLNWCLYLTYPLGFMKLVEQNCFVPSCKHCTAVFLALFWALQLLPGMFQLSTLVDFNHPCWELLKLYLPRVLIAEEIQRLFGYNIRKSSLISLRWCCSWTKSSSDLKHILAFVLGTCPWIQNVCTKPLYSWEYFTVPDCGAAIKGQDVLR